MGLAQTGTGKTAAFVLPILNRLVESKYGCVRALIIAPTRELAEQIHQAIETLGRETQIRSVSVYGGVGINPQIKKLKRADVVVACPGGNHRTCRYCQSRTLPGRPAFKNGAAVNAAEKHEYQFGAGLYPNQTSRQELGE